MRAPEFNPNAVAIALACGVSLVAHAQIVLRAQGPGAPTSERSAARPQAESSGPRVVLDRDLKAIPAQSVELQADAWRYVDSRGKGASIPRTGVLAIMPQRDTAQSKESAGIAWRVADAAGPSLGGRLELTDGQVLPGRLVGTSPDHIEWEHANVGRIHIPLDRVSLFVPVVRPLLGDMALPRGTEDSVALANGDRVSGFVAGVSMQGTNASLSIESGGKTTSLPLARVNAVRFANPLEAAGGGRVWLRDGSVLACDVAPAPGKGLSITPLALARSEGRPVASSEIRWSDVLAISMDAASVTPLAAIPVSRVIDAPGRAWTPAPKVAPARQAALGAADIELPGAMGVEWVLPARSARLAGAAELPPAARSFGDCTLTIELAGVEKPLFSERLSGTKPSVEFNVTIPPAGTNTGPTLRIRLEGGAGSPVQTRVILERALVMVK